MKGSIVNAALAFSVAVHARVARPKRDPSEHMAMSFDEIARSPELHWVPCFGNFTCANLEVPLDYQNSSVGSTNIAFVKHSAAKQPAEDILINPGGPGSSGVLYLLGSQSC